MSDLPSWPRSHLAGPPANAHLFWDVPGAFDGELKLRARHRSRGLPPGISLRIYSADERPEVRDFGTTGYFRRGLDALGKATADAVLTAPHVMRIRGQTSETATLDYLRDAVGVVQALLESGGLAVFDPFVLDWHSAEAWTKDVFGPGEPVPLRHVVILTSEEDEGAIWFHTRGMLKFGRPDISVRRVTPEQSEGVVDLCSRLIVLQALGGEVPDGQHVQMQGLPPWSCRTVGDLDDPEFNNRHIEIGPVGPRATT